jgi:hypothetical protein
MNILELAKQAGFQDADWNYDKGLEKALEKFAALVVANIDPKSFMSWQEGHEAGVAQEREACAAMCMAVPRTGAYFARLIRARGTT